MKKISVMMLVLMFVFGCGKIISPTGPSEAVAANTAENSSKISETEIGMPILSLFANSSNPQTTVRVGDKVVIEAIVENAVDLYGVAATIAFDNSKLEFVKIEEGWFIKQQNTTTFMSAIRLQELGRLVIGLSSLGKVNGVSGNGTLFRITFKALSSGQTELKFIDTTLCNSVPDGIGVQKIKKFESRPATVVIE